MKTFILLLILPFSTLAQNVVDVSDPTAIKLDTPDRGVITSGTLADTMANYPNLKDKLLAETAKKLSSENEISAQHHLRLVKSQKVQLPKDVLDKHTDRIAKFGKAKSDALASAVKKVLESLPKIDATSSQTEIDDFNKILVDARALASKAKAKKDELIAAEIPIAKAVSDLVESAQAKPVPQPSATSTPNDGL